MLHRWSDVTFIYLNKSCRSKTLFNWGFIIPTSIFKLLFLKQRPAHPLPKDVKTEEAGATGTPGAALALQQQQQKKINPH